jgi:hypothetical protein
MATQPGDDIVADKRREIGPEYAQYTLTDEFCEGLHGPGIPQLTSAFDKQRFAEYRKARRKYCEEFLRRLESEEGDPEPVHAARSRVHLELAHGITRDQGRQLSHLRQALEQARLSGYDWAINVVLVRLGDFYQDADRHGVDGAFEQAISYFKDALVHTPSRRSAEAMATVLHNLGMIYAGRRETLPQAVFMFDWSARFGASESHALIDKQKCRIRMGEREAVLRETELPEEPTIQQVATAIAAMHALKHDSAAIAAAAVRGVEIATRDNDRQWRLQFEADLMHATSKGAGSSSE